MSLLMFLKLDSWFSRASVIYRLPELRSSVASVISLLAVDIHSCCRRHPLDMQKSLVTASDCSRNEWLDSNECFSQMF